jgi:hypothetical protein
MKTHVQKNKTVKHAKLAFAIVTALICATTNAVAASKTSPEFAEFKVEEARYRAAEQGLSVVFYGSPMFTHMSSAKSAVSEKSLQELAEDTSRKIVIVEKGSQDEYLYKKLLAKGDFVISVGDVPFDASMSAFNELLEMPISGEKATNHLDDQGQAKLQITNADGKTHVSLVSAYFYSPYGSRSFFSGEENVQLAVAEAIEWARDLAMQPQKTQAKAATTLVHTRDYPYLCKWGNETVGKMNVYTTFTKVNENTAGDDFFAVEHRLDMIPGINVVPNQGWKFKNNNSTIQDNVKYRYTGWRIHDYGPETTSGTSSQTVELGITTPSFSKSWSYTTPDIFTSNFTDTGIGKTHWVHDMDQTKAIGSTTASIRPGYVLRTTGNSTKPWLWVDSHYYAYWVGSRPFFNNEYRGCILKWVPTW